MDTKTPPIPLKSQEKPQPKKTERVAEVFLPPLTPYPNYHPKNKSFGISSSQAPHCSIQHQDHCKKKLYRVLHIGATPLMHACQQGDRARVLRLLKEQEETIGYRDRTLRNALHYCMDAATGGAVAAVASELVNAPDAEGHTPLHLAVIAGDTQLVAVLMANGADINAKDLEGHSVLHWATVCGEAECVRLVLAAGARSSTPDLRGGSPLHYAAQCCGAAATAELAVPKKVGLKVLQTLLEFSADVNAKDEDGRQPILWAASAGSVEAVLALARAGGAAAAGTSDKDGLTALHCAASRGHARCVEVLINLCGSQPDHVDDNGCSALHYAATLGHADATALILKLGADPNRQDRKGRTPALCAAAKGQLETLKILIQHGGSLHARSVRGTGIGHEAVASGRIELIKWLAKKKPSMLDVATHDGKTPLHVAALHGHLDACKILLDHGARINAVLRTSKGNSMTPLDAALYRGHRDCAKLIQMHGGTTAQQLRAHKTTPNKVFTAKLRMKRNESSASDSSPCEERKIKSTHRKGNRKELGRCDSRSFSEEEVRLSSKKEERRARSVSARYDINGISSHNLHRKRNRRRSTRHKHEYLDSSIESDSCDYSHDDDGNETSMYRRAKRDKNRKSNETEAKSNARKEDDDDRSVSDDSLEVIVVKSLEEKCKKVVSGRRSRIPKECTKETKLTKMHKCISKKISRSSKSRTSDNDEDMTVRDKSPSKEEKRVEIKKPEVHILRTSPEEEKDDNERIMESRYEKSMTDSTSQETVEQVIVTAMVHKDQMPDTPKSTLETDKERTSFNGISRQKMTKGEETKEIPEYISSSDKPDKLKKQTVLEERVQQMTTQENSGTQIERKEETIEIIIPVAVEDTRDEKIDKTEEREVSLEEHSASTTMLKRMSGLDEENVKLPDSENIKLDDDAEIATRKASPNDEESKISAVRQFDITASHETVSSSKDNVESSRVIHEEKSRISTEPVKTMTPEKSESIKDLKEGEDLNKHDDDSQFSDKIRDDKKLRTQATKPIEQLTDKKGMSDSTREKSVNLSLTESKIMSKVNETFPLEKTRSSYDKKSGDTDRNDEKQLEIETGGKDFRYIDDSSSSSPKSSRPIKIRRSRSSTRGSARTRRSSAKATKKCLFESSEEHSPDRSAIVAVIDSPEWDEDEAVEKEIREALGEDAEHETEHEEDNEIGVMRVLPSTSEEEAPSTALGVSRASGIDSLPQVQSTSSNRLVTIKGPEDHRERPWRKQRRDSGGRDSGIEPSPRVSRIPRRRNIKCCPNTAKQQTLNMETITRDVQISLRRYHLERKIFFQLMELKRLQIRHGRANEHVLVKRQVDAFHKSGMIGPTLGVVKYDRPLTFRQFETFLYEQLRRLQGRPTTPDFCTEAKQCTQKTHRCHHATSAYTSVPVYTYLGGNVPDQMDHLPKIESRGRGQMTVEVTHGEGKQVIALPAEKLDRTKKYFVTFTVRSETQDIDKSKSSCVLQRKTKSV